MTCRVEPVSLGVDVAGNGIGEIADAAAEFGEQTPELPARRADAGAQRFRVGRPDEPLDRLHERPVRRPHDRVAGAVEHKNTVGCDLPRKLPHEAALARPGLAADERDPTPLTLRPRHEGAQGRLFA